MPSSGSDLLAPRSRAGSACVTAREASISSVALRDCRIVPAFDGGVEIVEAAPHNRSFPTRISESLGICLKVGADHDVKADGKLRRYPADSVCVRTPGCVWSTEATGAVGFLSIDITRSLLPQGGLSGGMLFVAAGKLPNLRRAAGSLAQATSALEHQSVITALINSLIESHVLRSHDLGPAPPPRAVALSREMLTARLDDPPSLQELADTVGGSRFVLLRRFQRVTGLPPHAFVVRLRVERARWLLARGVDIAEAAHAVGFADQSHFSRAFKRVIGLSPGAYQRQVRTVG